jgi:YHS domain-containing protein
MVFRNLIVAVGLAALVAGGSLAAQQDDAAAPSREIPSPFARFEYLVGSWKGTGVPTANRVRGWTETHAWAWKFEKGVPIGLNVTMQGDKALSKGQLRYEPATKRYVLGGSDAAGKPVAFAGTLDKAGKTLTLDRVGPTSGGSKQRLTLFPNANFVRYTIAVAEQEEGAPQFKRMIEVGVTKEGEAFAAGGAAADLPKCIVTGGAATMTVSFQGKSYPLCCTGCRDEFNDNPEKYLKKLALRAEAAGKSASTARNKDDGSFDGLVDEPKAVPKVPEASKAEAPKEKAGAAKPSTATAKAASLLRLAQNLEKSKKTDAALTYYRQIVKDYPDTPSSKSAASRIKVLSPPSSD